MTLEATARPAATIMLLRDGADGMEVFMVVRHHAIDFASGALVFPGGRVEEADYALAAQLLDRPEPDEPDEPETTALAFRIAAIRETFEECGVLLARPRGSNRIISAARLKRLDDQHRAALIAGSIGFDMVLESEGLVPAPDLLVRFAHWITPVNQPKRYDTHFFLAAAPREHLAVHDGGEAVDSTWITPQRALSEAEAGHYRLVFATAKNLEKLGHSRTVKEAMDAARTSKIVTVQPRGTRLEGGKRLLRIPPEAGYGGSEFIVEMPPAS
jgi:8-oxo-dGTP pyrophosphatase MutT (NUDIX family)